MKEERVVSFSGGKDSTALILHLKEQGIEHQTVFCDTGWEHQITTDYIEYINETILNGELITLVHKRFPKGMREMVKFYKQVPNARFRSCTGILKVQPMMQWLKTQEIEIVYQGIRAEESTKRAQMDKREFNKDYDAYIERPLMDWKAQDVFDIHKKHDIKPNPLYLKGAERVGCFPCIMINHREIKNTRDEFPEIWENMEELEKLSGGYFFGAGYIPKRYQTGENKKGQKIPTIDDVKKYLETPESLGQLSFMPPQKCMSVYNLCE